MHLKAINLSMMEDAAPAVIANGKIFFIRFVAQWHFNSMVSVHCLIHLNQVTQVFTFP